MNIIIKIAKVKNNRQIYQKTDHCTYAQIERYSHKLKHSHIHKKKREEKWIKLQQMIEITPKQ